MQTIRSQVARWAVAVVAVLAVVGCGVSGAGTNVGDADTVAAIGGDGATTGTPQDVAVSRDPGAGGCLDDCVAVGIAVCQGGLRRECVRSEEGCLVLGAGAECPSPQVCARGECTAPCPDQQCTAGGVTACVGDAVMVCDDHNFDGCLAWGTPVPCATGERCVDGACQGACADECPAAGAVECVGASVRRCGDTDADACLEWGDPVPCGPGEACAAGRCGAPGSCADADCSSPGTWECAGGNGARFCGVDPESGCAALGNFSSCAVGNSCQGTECTGACLEPEVMLIVDRSSSMEGSLWDGTEAAINAIVGAFARKARFGLRMFPGGDGCAPGAVVPMAQDNAGAVRGALTPPSTASATPIAAAFEGLTDAYGDPNQGEVAILITDGSETCGSRDELRDAVQRLRNRGVAIHVIGVGTGFDSQLLAEVAEIGGTGSVRQAATGAAVNGALLAVLEQTGVCCADDDGDGYGLLCAAGADCNDDDGSVHAPECSGRECGPDGCGGQCGACADNDPRGTGTCESGQCVIVCDRGWHECGGVCRDDTDPRTCGGRCEPCPTALGTRATCSAGACGDECLDDHHRCGDACYPDDDPDHCGADCVACSPPAGGQALCIDGVCSEGCPAGQELCSGSCVELHADPQHCGACDNDCGADAGCTEGICVCDTSWRLGQPVIVERFGFSFGGDLGDFDRDGSIDIVAVAGTRSDSSSATLHVYLNDGAGAFGDAIETAAVSGDEYARDAAVLDFNGDGFDDVVVINRDRVTFETKYSQVRFMRGLGDGLFGEDTAFGLGFTPNAGTPRRVMARDLNGDGLADVVTLKNNGGNFEGTLRIFLARQDAPYDGVYFHSIDGGSSLALGDFNGDGYGDAAVAPSWGDCIGVLASSRGEVYSGQEDLPCRGGADLVGADFDSDGADELLSIRLLSELEPPAMQVQFHEARGSRWSARQVATFPGEQSYAAGAGDLDGDEWLDAVVAYRRENVVHVRALMGSRDGVLCPHTGVSVTSADGALAEVMVADVHRDGCADVVLIAGDIWVLPGVCE